jgi:hypothetical protein
MDRRTRAARRQPCLGLSAGCRRDDRAFGRPRERSKRFRIVSFFRPSTGGRRNGGGDPKRDGQAAFARVALSVALQPFVRLFHEMAEMRYLWSEAVSLDGGKLKAFLGCALPATRLDAAVRDSLVGLGCLDNGGEAQRRLPAPSQAAR